MSRRQSGNSCFTIALIITILCGGCGSTASPNNVFSKMEENNDKAETEISSNVGDKNSTGEVGNLPDVNNVSVDEILSQLTLEQKIGQMVMPAVRGLQPDKDENYKLPQNVANAIADCNIGGIIFFEENCRTTEGTLKLAKELSNAAVSDRSIAKIPIMISVDQEGGRVTRLATGTKLPGNMAVAATKDPDNAYKAATVISEELNALDIDINLAPVMDVNSNPDNPVIGVRSFSDNPAEVAEYGVKYMKGLQDNGVIATLKHFPGHGDTLTDSHSGLPCIDKSYDELKSIELVPFKAAIDAGADIVMTAHIQFPQLEKETYKSVSTGEELTLPATLSKTIITDILRTDLGFDGVVMTDGLEMAAVASHFDPIDTAELAINAGVDVLLIPGDISNEKGIKNLKVYIDEVAKRVRTGKISEDRIDESVRRILELKVSKGLFNAEDTYEDMVADALATVGSEEHHNIEKSIMQTKE